MYGQPVTPQQWGSQGNEAQHQLGDGQGNEAQWPYDERYLSAGGSQQPYLPYDRTTQPWAPRQVPPTPPWTGEITPEIAPQPGEHPLWKKIRDMKDLKHGMRAARHVPPRQEPYQHQRVTWQKPPEDWGNNSYAWGQPQENKLMGNPQIEEADMILRNEKLIQNIPLPPSTITPSETYCSPAHELRTGETVTPGQPLVKFEEGPLDEIAVRVPIPMDTGEPIEPKTESVQGPSPGVGPVLRPSTRAMRACRKLSVRGEADNSSPASPQDSREAWEQVPAATEAEPKAKDAEAERVPADTEAGHQSKDAEGDETPEGTEAEGSPGENSKEAAYRRRAAAAESMRLITGKMEKARNVMLRTHRKLQETAIAQGINKDKLNNNIIRGRFTQELHSLVEIARSLQGSWAAALEDEIWEDLADVALQTRNDIEGISVDTEARRPWGANEELRRVVGRLISGLRHCKDVLDPSKARNRRNKNWQLWATVLDDPGANVSDQEEGGLLIVDGAHTAAREIRRLKPHNFVLTSQTERKVRQHILRSNLHGMVPLLEGSIVAVRETWKYVSARGHPTTIALTHVVEYVHTILAQISTWMQEEEYQNLTTSSLRQVTPTMKLLKEAMTEMLKELTECYSLSQKALTDTIVQLQILQGHLRKEPFMPGR
jgi:hypothetical protein